MTLAGRAPRERPAREPLPLGATLDLAAQTGALAAARGTVSGDVVLISEVK
jgi:hypothetical protein